MPTKMLTSESQYEKVISLIIQKTLMNDNGSDIFLILNKLKINHFKYLEKVSELFTTLSQFLSLK